MKRLILLVTAMAFLVSGSLAMARDTSWESLRQQEKQQQIEQKKIEAQLKAAENASKADTAKAKAETGDRSSN
jgi:hemolysin activation/secretion protein